MKIKKCECCKNTIIYGNNKFCSNCALYTKKLREKVSLTKREIKLLRIKMYGQNKGWERIR